jgi:hypothetical protein
LAWSPPTIPENVKSIPPFVTFKNALFDALRVAQKAFPESAEVLIFPNLRITYPRFIRLIDIKT